MVCSLWATLPFMVAVRRTEHFDRWLRDLKDRRARVKVLARIDRLIAGNPGDVAPVGDGISELRVHFGPGYRVYFQKRGGELIILLAGGDESSQSRDIQLAKNLAASIEE